MATVLIRWGAADPVTTRHRLPSGLYVFRSMGERMSFTVLRGPRAEDIAPGLAGSISETGQTYVIAVNEGDVTMLSTETFFPGDALVTINRLKHQPSGRNPSIRDNQLVIVADKTEPKRHRARAQRSVRVTV